MLVSLAEGFHHDGTTNTKECGEFLNHETDEMTRKKCKCESGGDNG
ncbi:hypothetical protein PLANPX_3092 [Lacipirellula parvula]|uniref:Uncharacterized protein n=1 Tax=Lacipirellula parvula TaxID=2650471 RepID=A0A5K7X9T2_9BACT|nr:hypothetical protein PLANPX_3092 [Lacipirellula parvula]